MYRQGDLLFIKTDKIPEEAKEQRDGILARGGATGHTHRIRTPEQNAMLVLAGIAYIKAVYECLVDHQEHDTITLPPGNWQVKRQREYEPEGWKYVED